MTSSEAQRHWNRKIAHSLLLRLDAPSTLPPSLTHFWLFLCLFFFFFCVWLSLTRPPASEARFFYCARRLEGWHSREEEEKNGRSSTRLLQNLKSLLHHMAGCAEWSIYIKLEHRRDNLNSTFNPNSSRTLCVYVCVNRGRWFVERVLFIWDVSFFFLFFLRYIGRYSAECIVILHMNNI